VSDPLLATSAATHAPLSATTGLPTLLPTVSIIVVNWNGLEHLQPCLASLTALDYPVDRFEIVLIDNASSDGSVEFVRAHFPGVRISVQSTNIGFAPAVNLGAELSTRDAVALVNNDMRVSPSWLRELAGKFAPAEGIACVAGTILNWEGTELDFGGGAVNFHGFGEQPGNGTPIAEARLVDGSVQPFACGGALLVDRQTFVDLGGFDPKFFAYFEDVDFGLRLQVCGHRTVLAANARSFHRHHGTSSRFRWHERMVLLERNALRLLIKNVDDSSLAPLLAGAMLMQSQRALFDAHSERADYDVGIGREDITAVNRLAISRLHATDDVLQDLPQLLELRRQIQQRRTTPDHEVFSSYGLPLMPMGNSDAGYANVFNSVVSMLSIDQLFQGVGVKRIVVLCHDLIGERMAGTAIRAWEMACALAQYGEVTVACDRPVDRRHPGVVSLLIEGDAGMDAFRRCVDLADAVVLFGFDVVRYPFLAQTRALRIVDLYDPWIFGSLEQYDAMTVEGADAAKNHEINALNQLIDIGDMFICASERQRDFWMGMLASRGRLDKRAHDIDPQLRKLIDVVPFGVPPQVKVDRTVAPQTDGLVVLWAGGTWDWFDPLGVVEAFNDLRDEFPTAQLHFMGLELEGRGVPAMSMTGQLRVRLKQLGLVDSGRVVLGPWAAYDQRGAILRSADVGVVAAKNLAENRMAFRTRMLDHFWAGLPTLATSGDVLAELVAISGAGVVVPPENPAAMRDGLRQLLGDAELRQRSSAAALGLADQFRWTDVVRPIVGLVQDPQPYRAARRLPTGA
jgi:GT2 family glycosyltransferase/glycosyltransferase involved in cell wall biosynthesis